MSKITKQRSERDTGPVVSGRAQAHLHTSPVCARCLQSAVTVPPLLGHRSYRLLEKKREGGNIEGGDITAEGKCNKVFLSPLWR